MRAAVGVAAAAALLRRDALGYPSRRDASRPAELPSAEPDFSGLWEGLDVELSQEDAPASRVALLRVKGRQFAIVGQYDTGTNLLQKMMASHFPKGLKLDQEAHKKEDVGHYLWKHTKPESISPEVRQKLNETVALVMIRDPLSWLQSLKKAPYDLKKCTRKALWLTAPCTTPPTYTEWIAHPDKLLRSPPPKFLYAPQKELTLPNIESFWNEWTRDYTHLKDFGFADTLLIRYEDLVTETQTELRRIAKILSVPAPTEVTPLKSAAKSHGQPSGRDAALRKIREKPYLANYSAAERKAVCARLDAALLRRFNYTDCLGGSVHGG